MKKKVLFISLVFAISTVTSAQNKNVISKINMVGAGYGFEYFLYPDISWHNEIGISYWEKLNDNIQNEKSYPGITYLNPYFSSSLRYYFIPVHASKNGKLDIGRKI